MSSSPKEISLKVYDDLAYSYWSFIKGEII